MDRIASSRVVDPHHDQPPPSPGPAQDRMVVPERVVAFIPCWIGQHLLDVREGDAALRMVLAKMFAIGPVPGQRPVVHTDSIYAV